MEDVEKSEGLAGRRRVETVGSGSGAIALNGVVGWVDPLLWGNMQPKAPSCIVPR